MENKQLNRFKIIPLFGEITDESIKDATTALLRESKQDVLLFINSPGGSIDAGRSLINAMQWCKRDVYTIANGGIYSMAFQILLYGKIRFSLPHSLFMFHDTKYDFSHYKYPHDVEDVVSIQKYADKILTDDMIRKTKLTKNELNKAFTLKRDTYLTTPEALKLGVIDYCITKEEELIKIIDSNVAKHKTATNVVAKRDSKNKVTQKIDNNL